eukprot:364841-Chlamydomonas_euryale.AAC.2
MRDEILCLVDMAEREVTSLDKDKPSDAALVKIGDAMVNMAKALQGSADVNAAPSVNCAKEYQSLQAIKDMFTTEEYENQKTIIRLKWFPDP